MIPQSKVPSLEGLPREQLSLRLARFHLDGKSRNRKLEIHTDGYRVNRALTNYQVIGLIAARPCRGCLSDTHTLMDQVSRGGRLAQPRSKPSPLLGESNYIGKSSALVGA